MRCLTGHKLSPQRKQTDPLPPLLPVAVHTTVHPLINLRAERCYLKYARPVSSDSGAAFDETDVFSLRQPLAVVWYYKTPASDSPWPLITNCLW